MEPYLTGSHQAWAEGYATASAHDVQILSLPGRFWKWRMFGGTLSLGQQASQREAPDVILASDMLDLPSFLGHTGPSLAKAKTVLYMHENQLTYPLSPTARDDLAYAYMNWSSMVRADEVWFNSQFHLDSVFEALPRFLRHFPDHRHTSLVDAVAGKSSVLPVGVDLSWCKPATEGRVASIVWNQRWEYDKDPVRLFEALYRLAERGAEFRLSICGENFRNVPNEFDVARSRLSDVIDHFGFADMESYRDILNRSNIVISTAKHEFFGVAVVEAMAAGAAPVLPNGLSYPELVPDELLEDILYDTDDALDYKLDRLVAGQEIREDISRQASAHVQRFSWEAVAPLYDERLA